MGGSLTELSVFEIQKDQYDRSLVSKGDSGERLSQRSRQQVSLWWFKTLEFVLPKEKEYLSRGMRLKESSVIKCYIEEWEHFWSHCALHCKL